MSFLGETYRADEMPESQSFDPLPSGWYTATIAGAEVKETKAGTGKYIAVRYDITGPSHEGRVVFGNINIRNPTVKAEEIGRQQLGEIMRAIGVGEIENSDQLIGGSLSIKLTIQKSEEYGDRNEVKGFKAIDGSRPPSAAPGASSSAPAAAGAAPPWARR